MNINNARTLHWLKQTLYPFILGGALVLGFSPFNYWWICLLVFPLLIQHLEKQTSIRLSFWTGICFGLGLFGIGASWIYVSIHVYGHSPVWLAGLVTLLFVFILSLYPALTLALWKAIDLKSHPNPRPPAGEGTIITWQKIILFAGIWTLMEWIRSYFLSGFPWLLLGYSQTDGMLAGLAPMIGVYGLSFLVLIAAGLVLTIAQRSSGQIIPWVSCTLLVALAIVPYFLGQIAWTSPTQKMVYAHLVQPNISPDARWQYDHQDDIFKVLKEQTFTALASGQPEQLQLVIWPEAAVPTPLPYSQPWLTQWDGLLKIRHASLITGVLEMAENKQYYNAMLAVGQGNGDYAKRHLVPFGEYIPFESLFGKLFNIMAVPRPATIAGAADQSLLHAFNTPHASIPVVSAICYEIAYPELVAHNARMGQAQYLITVSNDTWFGCSLGPKQHGQIARMRSMELGLPLLRATNSGLTFVTDQKGQITAELPSFETATLSVKTMGYQGNTPLMYYGHGVILALILLISLLTYLYRARK